MTEIKVSEATVTNNIPATNNKKQENKTQEASIWRKAGGYVAGTATAVALQHSGPLFAYPIFKIVPKPTEAESKVLESVYNDVLKSFKLHDKGIVTWLNSHITAFDYNSKILHVSSESLGKDFGVFHELGHAHNTFFGKISKIFQQFRVIPRTNTKTGAIIGTISALLLTIALLTNKKEKNDNIFDKSTSFIKNNIGKIIFATTIPTLLEEGLASIKAHKVAKGFLPKDILFRMNKHNALAFATYLIGATMFGIAANVGVKVRDKIVGQ